MDETSGDAFDQGLLASQRIVVVWFTLIRGRKDLETQATRNPMRILVRACKEKTVRRQGSKRRSVNCGIALGLAFRHSRHRTHGRVSPLTRWPSGLRRCVQVAVRKGAGSNPARVTVFVPAQGGLAQGCSCNHRKPPDVQRMTAASLGEGGGTNTILWQEGAVVAGAEAKCTSGESNSGLVRGKDLCYHYTTSAGREEVARSR